MCSGDLRGDTTALVYITVEQTSNHIHIGLSHVIRTINNADNPNGRKWNA